MPTKKKFENLKKTMESIPGDIKNKIGDLHNADQFKLSDNNNSHHLDLKTPKTSNSKGKSKNSKNSKSSQKSKKLKASNYLADELDDSFDLFELLKSNPGPSPIDKHHQIESKDGSKIGDYFSPLENDEKLTIQEVHPI